MEDLWPQFASAFDANLGGVHLVRTLEESALETALAHLLDAFGLVLCVLGYGCTGIRDLGDAPRHGLTGV